MSDMSNEKSTGELLEIIREQSSFGSAHDMIRSEQITETLSELLNRTAAERGAKLSDILKRSGLKKAYFYSLFNGTRTNPARDILIQLCFGFEMSFEEAQSFLTSTGAAPLYPRIPRDSVLIYCFQHSLTLTESDILLLENNEPPLSKE